MEQEQSKTHMQENHQEEYIKNPMDASYISFFKPDDSTALQESSGSAYTFPGSSPGVNLTRARTGLERFMHKFQSWPLINSERGLINKNV